jgi:hypothetical protein
MSKWSVIKEEEYEALRFVTDSAHIPGTETSANDCDDHEEVNPHQQLKDATRCFWKKSNLMWLKDQPAIKI